MSEIDFITAAKKVLAVNKKFETPGNGLNKIKSVSDSGFSYQKRPRDSKPEEKWNAIYVNFVDFFKAYVKYKGEICSSNTLKSHAPHIFDSNTKGGPKGHSCNCSMFFILLRELKLVDRILGEGVRGSPFYVKIQ